MAETLTTGQMLDRLLEGEVAENEKGQKVRLGKLGTLLWVNNSSFRLPVIMTSEVLLSRWTIAEEKEQAS